MDQLRYCRIYTQNATRFSLFPAAYRANWGYCWRFVGLPKLLSAPIAKSLTSLFTQKALDGAGHIYAVDMLPAMLAVAKKNIPADNITFHPGAPETVNDVIKKNVNRVISNSAFQQMSTDKTFQNFNQFS